MKTLKALLAALSVTALSSTAMAYEWNSDRVFVGVEGGMGWNSLDSKINVNQQLEFTGKEDNVKSKFFGARIGTYMQDIFRIYATVSWNMLDDTTLNLKSANDPEEASFKDLRQMNILFSGDYLFMPQSQFHPFVGLTLGATQNKLKLYGLNESQEKWGIAYGAQAGILFPVESMDLEVGVKYLGNNATIEKSGSISILDTPISGSMKTDMTHSKQVYLALSFRF